MGVPKVSVIIPVYNAESYLTESIESILNQSYGNFEFIIINDGSTDNSVEVIKKYDDRRIKLIDSEKNQGLVAVRNRGIRESKGDYIAWLDADDISHKLRLEKQVQVLESNSSIGICGTWVKTFGLENSIWEYPADSELIRCNFLFEDTLATSSVMLRRQILTANSLFFDKDYSLAEDYNLWEKMLHHCKAVNIPEVLTFYRTHESQTSKSTKNLIIQKENVWRIQKRQLERMRIFSNQPESIIHQKLGRWEREHSKNYINDAQIWLDKLAEANRTTGIYPEVMLLKVLGQRWVFLCNHNTNFGLWTLRRFWSCKTKISSTVRWKHKVKLMCKCAIKWSNNE